MKKNSRGKLMRDDRDRLRGPCGKNFCRGAAIEVMVQRLKVDAAIALQTYRFMIPENQSFRYEGVIDGPGLAEMIRLLEADKLIPKREPWETFVDSGFMPASK